MSSQLKSISIRELRRKGTFAVLKLPLRLSRWGKTVGVIVSEEDFNRIKEQL